jgi:hypothetical protein
VALVAWVAWVALVAWVAWVTWVAWVACPLCLQAGVMRCCERLCLQPERVPVVHARFDHQRHHRSRHAAQDDNR